MSLGITFLFILRVEEPLTLNFQTIFVYDGIYYQIFPGSIQKTVCGTISLSSNDGHYINVLITKVESIFTHTNIKQIYFSAAFRFVPFALAIDNKIVNCNYFLNIVVYMY